MDIKLEMKENVQKGGIQISGDNGIKIKSLSSTYSQSLIFIRKENFRRSPFGKRLFHKKLLLTNKEQPFITFLTTIKF